MAQYELWDTDTGNIIGVYPDEASALAMIHASVTEDGPGPWQSVGLLKIGDTEDEDQLIAEGEALIALTHPRTPVRRS